MPLPASCELIEWIPTKSAHGHGGLDAKYKCDIADTVAAMAFLAYAYDGEDPTLMCASVTPNYMGGDPANGKRILACKFQPYDMVQHKVPGGKCLRKIVGSSLTMVRPGRMVWADGTPLDVTNPDKIRPVMTFPTQLIEYHFCETTYSGSRFTAYAGKVNSSTFDGIPAEMAKFKTASCSQRVSADSGNIVFDWAAQVERCWHNWNKVPKGLDAALEYLYIANADGTPSADLSYPLASYNGLLPSAGVVS
jgi:hypothetical protein